MSPISSTAQVYCVNPSGMQASFRRQMMGGGMMNDQSPKSNADSRYYAQADASALSQFGQPVLGHGNVFGDAEENNGFSPLSHVVNHHARSRYAPSSRSRS